MSEGVLRDLIRINEEFFSLCGSDSIGVSDIKQVGIGVQSLVDDFVAYWDNKRQLGKSICYDTFEAQYQLLFLVASLFHRLIALKGFKDNAELRELGDTIMERVRRADALHGLITFLGF